MCRGVFNRTKIVYLNKALYHYVKRPNSLSSGNQGNNEIHITADNLEHSFKRIEKILDKYNLKKEFEKPYNNYVTKQAFISYIGFSRRIKHCYKSLLSEQAYIRFESLTQNFGRSFLESIFSVSTEASIEILFKKVVFLGYSFIFKVSK